MSAFQSLDANSRTRSSIPKHSLKTPTPKTASILPNTVFTKHTVASTTWCSHGDTMRCAALTTHMRCLSLIPAQYLYHVFKDQSSLPLEALAMIRYHSFYPWHREGAYTHLTNEKDNEILAAVRAFNPYDLYSKSDEPCDPVKLRPYYEGLIAKFFPPVLDWWPSF